MPKLKKLIASSALPHNDIRIREIHSYQIWTGLIARCYDTSDTNYLKFGGRGVKVTRRWRNENGFANFLADMGPRPRDHWLLLKRGTRNYAKANCYWISPADLNRKRAIERRKLRSRSSSLRPSPA